MSTQIGLSMMEVTKVMKKTSRRDSVLMSFDVFKDLYICNLQLDPFNMFIICLSDISYQERSFTNLCSLSRGRQERVTYHANYAANMDKIAKLQKVKSSILGR